jgi:glucose-6-phosphate isomerase
VGVTGKRIETIVNIGIGGSDLGPVMIYEALKPYVQEGLSCRFISNIDPTDAAQKTAGLDPETTLVIVASKTFTTLETLTNARLVRAWLLDALTEQGAIDGSDAASGRRGRQALRRRVDRPGQGGGLRDRPGQRLRLLGLGRRSLLGRLGDRHRVVCAIGPERFAELLAGFHAVDEHFRSAPLPRNVPALMGLLNVWYVNFLDARSHAVLPYAQQLHRFAAYLQQLTMESNGKSVRWDGSPVTTATGEVFWGEPGTNGQHAFYQLIHQGTQLIPATSSRCHAGLPLVDQRRRAAPTCTSCSWPTSSRRPRPWPSARPPTRCAPRAPRRRSCPPGCSPATSRRPRSWRRR